MQQPSTITIARTMSTAVGVEVEVVPAQAALLDPAENSCHQPVQAEIAL